MKLKKRINRILGLLLAFSTVILPILYFIFRHRLKFDKDNKNFNKIIIYGDTRSSYKIHNKVSKLIVKEKPDMVLFTGDVASNSHNFIHFLHQGMIEYKIWKNIEYYPTRGNHEDDLLYYKLFFDLPNGKTYYSFNRNNMHFIVLDVIDGSKDIDKEQFDWLIKDLEEHKNIPISISLHLPLFTSGHYYPYDNKNLLELIEKYNVLFVFSAHVHCYEHSLYKGTHFIVTAGGGAPLYRPTHENPYQIIRHQKHHYCILTNDNDIYTLTVKDIDENIIDTVSTSIKMKEENKL